MARAVPRAAQLLEPRWPVPRGDIDAEGSTCVHSEAPVAGIWCWTVAVSSSCTPPSTHWSLRLGLPIAQLLFVRILRQLSAPPQSSSNSSARPCCLCTQHGCVQPAKVSQLQQTRSVTMHAIFSHDRGHCAHQNFLYQTGATRRQVAVYFVCVNVSQHQAVQC